MSGFDVLTRGDVLDSALQARDYLVSCGVPGALAAKDPRLWGRRAVDHSRLGWLDLPPAHHLRIEPERLPRLGPGERRVDDEVASVLADAPRRIGFQAPLQSAHDEIGRQIEPAGGGEKMRKLAAVFRARPARLFVGTVLVKIGACGLRDGHSENKSDGAQHENPL